jgi:hypothetical protein
MDRDEMSTIYRGPSIDASVMILKNIFIFSSPCQRQRELLSSLGVRRPLNFHILIFSSETPQPNELNASYQVSVHLAKRFQRRRFFIIGQSETRIACGGHIC